ncbi:hypothetical protein [Streptomyces abikoensis]|uniref:hypothetical protein n=1 Tax=Streptomyces abikoensis TaxID=97398 RepID=UPI00167488E7|nr:hypothetical protein [Streptomyces abikoensis]GGP36834.1 hypothetical protein GCM10010214_07260 [Streptomyces abikoensis]
MTSQDVTTEASGASTSEAGLQPRLGQFVHQAIALRDQADELLKRAVEHERARGTSWEQIGQELGVSRSAAQQRFGRGTKDYGRAASRARLETAWLKAKRLVQDYEALEGLQNLSSSVSTATANDGEIQLPPHTRIHETFSGSSEPSLVWWLKRQTAPEEPRSIPSVLTEAMAVELYRDLKRAADRVLSDPAPDTAGSLQGTDAEVARGASERALLVSLAALRGTCPKAVEQAAARLLGQTEPAAAIRDSESGTSTAEGTIEERLARLENLVDELLKKGRTTAKAD